MLRTTPSRRRATSALAAVFTAVAAVAFTACGKDSTSPSGGGTTGPTLSITADSATDSLRAPAGSAITVGVHLKNPDGSPAVGVTVSWGVSIGTGSVPSHTTITDAAGATSTPWTLDTIAGLNTLNASVPSANVNITAFGLAGPVASLVKASPDSQSFVSGASAVLVVRALDARKNPVDSVPVTWTTTGGILSPMSTFTGLTGQATAVLTVGSPPTTYTVTATGPGGLKVSYTVKGI